jgi:hypothetical protein
MSDKVQAFIEIFLNIIRGIVGSPVLVFLAIGLMTILFGVLLNVGGVIVLGVFFC